MTPLLSPYAQAGPAMPTRPRANAAWLPNASHGQMEQTCGETASANKHSGKASSTSKQLPTLFTSAQAHTGHKKLEKHCARCHGPKLQGRAGPALKGPNFASADANLQVSDIFNMLAHQMPATQQGSLSHQDYADIMVFLLRENGYPAGSSKLTFQQASKSKVKLLYHGQ
jgi:polar amino acid transport system substrate-binding protein